MAHSHDSGGLTEGQPHTQKVCFTHMDSICHMVLMIGPHYACASPFQSSCDGNQIHTSMTSGRGLRSIQSSLHAHICVVILSFVLTKIPVVKKMVQMVSDGNTMIYHGT